MISRILSLLIFIFFLMGCQETSRPDQKTYSAKSHPAAQNGPISLVIHGGAGNILKENMTPETESAYQDKLKEALLTGYSVLDSGGSSMDAVIATIQVMEQSPLFNAGKGAVFTNEGKNELDAAVMDGKSGMAGAVAGVSHIKSPILAARTVMEMSPHVMMSGEGAEHFARESGLEMVEADYFFTQKRYDQWQHAKKTAYMNSYPDYKFGTVGCVALDANGNLAAGTSTGGMTNKKYGRIGDSPIIGAGTYADNATCGVSATGHGEFFIRAVVAYDIAALMKYKGMSLEDATKEVVNKKLVDLGGDGGVIAMDTQGNISMPFNTPGMFRGYIRKGEDPTVFLYKN